MDIDKNLCVAAFERLGLKDSSAYFGEYSQNGPFKLIEEGLIDENEFHAHLHSALPDDVTDAQIDAAFCDFLIGIPPHRLAFLRKLRNDYKIFLLSNTNPIMWNSKIKDEFTRESFTREDYFDGIVTSFEAKALKPDKAIFNYAVEKLGILPEETLFFDDSQLNLDAAAALGFKTALADADHQFITYFS